MKAAPGSKWVPKIELARTRFFLASACIPFNSNWQAYNKIEWKLSLCYTLLLKTKTAANQRKTAYSGCFGTPGETRTHYIPLRRRTLYPGEVRGLIQQIFNFRAQQDLNNLPLRRRTLYPTELLGRIQKIFNFTELRDSNDSIFRRGLLYPFNYGGRFFIAAFSVLLFSK